MNWGKFFKVFLINVIGVVFLAGLVLGLFGFLLAGQEGFVNGAIWGLTLGLFSVPFTGFIIMAKYWGDYSGRFGADWLKKEMEGDEAWRRR